MDDKRVEKEMFLLGAGASVEAEVPLAVDMTKRMLEKLSISYQFNNRIGKILRFVVGGLLFEKGRRGENPFEGVNVEDVFNTVDLLGQRQNSELGAFISSWNPSLDSLEGGEISESTAQYILERMAAWLKQSGRGFTTQKFAEDFSKGINEYLSGSRGYWFHTTAEVMIRLLVEMVWVDNSEKVKHLIPLIKYARDRKAVIATLNYDNTVELAGKIAEIKVDTGFDAWSSIGSFVFEEEQLPLIKLHGTIDWELSAQFPSQEKPIRHGEIHKVDPNSTKAKDFRPAVIFGGKNKLTAQEPFLSLLIAFKNFLDKTERLTVIGYSFRDDHINELVGNWLNCDHARKMKIIDIVIDRRNDFLDSLSWARQDGRVITIQKPAGEAIREIGGVV